MNILDQLSQDISSLKSTYENGFYELKSMVVKILNEDKYYSIQEFSDKVGIHYQTTRNAIKDGRIKAKKFGSRRIMIHSSEVDRIMESVKSLKYRRDGKE